MNTLEILTAARSLITKEENWCQEAFAKDFSGEVTLAKESNACSWCSIGALKKVSNWGAYCKAETFLNDYMQGSVSDFNDSHSHSEVLSKWDEAIANAEKDVK